MDKGKWMSTAKTEWFLSKCWFIRGIQNLQSNLNNPPGLFFRIFSFTLVWHQQREMLISPEPKISSLPSLYPLGFIFLRLFTGKQRLLCGGSGISHRPLLHFDRSHTHHPVYVPLLMYVWDRRSISLLCWSPRCARVTERQRKKKK